MVSIKILYTIFMIEIVVHVSQQNSDFATGEKKSENYRKQSPPNLDITRLCSLQPNGTAVLPVDPTICTRLYISCNNYAATFKRCEESTAYLNPTTLKCEDVSKVEVCRKFHKLATTPDLSMQNSLSSTTFPPLPIWTTDIVDGATSYCRSKQNWDGQKCDDFDKCCKSHCFGNVAEPTCNSYSENGTEIFKDQAFCRCTQQTYLSNQIITDRCLPSDDCFTFHMCCLLEGCPNIYVQCESSATDNKPIKGVCYC